MPKHWIYALGNLGLCILVMHFKWIKIGKFASGMATHRWTFNPIYANACIYIFYLMNIYTPNPYKYISTFNIKNNCIVSHMNLWIKLNQNNISIYSVKVVRLLMICLIIIFHKRFESFSSSFDISVQKYFCSFLGDFFEHFAAYTWINV